MLIMWFKNSNYEFKLCKERFHKSMATIYSPATVGENAEYS